MTRAGENNLGPNMSSTVQDLSVCLVVLLVQIEIFNMETSKNGHRSKLRDVEKKKRNVRARSKRDENEMQRRNPTARDGRWWQSRVTLESSCLTLFYRKIRD